MVIVCTVLGTITYVSDILGDCYSVLSDCCLGVSSQKSYIFQ